MQMQILCCTLLGILFFPPILGFFLCVVRFLMAPWSRSLPPDLGQLVVPKTFKDRFLGVVSQLEYYVCVLRYFFVGIPLALFLLYALYRHFGSETPLMSPVVLSFLCGIVFLNFWSHATKLASMLRLAEFLRQYPHVHPEDFFILAKRELAFGIPQIFEVSGLRALLPTDTDFRGKGRPRQSFWLVLVAAIDTAYLARLIILGLQKMGPHYVRDVGDAVTVMWGKRLLQLSHNHLEVAGLEEIRGRQGKFILIFNHKSVLDFVITFFALSQIRVGNRTLRPRFIVAKDHFKDNLFLYQVLGVGRAIEALDMVFIERKDRARSFQNLKEAAHAVVSKDLDIAVYPQGTRAAGNFDRAGKRRDAGYYTTVSAKNPLSSLAHLKKGTPHLIFDVLSEMRACQMVEKLNLVFVGIKGTANTLPRNSLRVQTENSVQFIVGDVVSLSPGILDDVCPYPSANENDVVDAAVVEQEFQTKKIQFINDMNMLIDEKIKLAIGLHQTLKNRFLTDLKGAFRLDENKIEQVSRALDDIAEQSSGVYQIIDRVYSLPTNEWNGYLSQLCQLLQGRGDVDRFSGILMDVSKKLVA